MKNWPSGLLTDIEAGVTTMATCLKMTRTDSVVMGFTAHPEVLLIDGVTYNPQTAAISSTAISSSSDLSVDNLEISGFLDDAAITESDLLAGVYDFAAFEIFLVNYEAIAHGVGTLSAGTFGELKYEDGKITFECRSLSQPLQQQIGDFYSPDCRANFCDYPAANGIWRCNLNSAGYIVTGSVTNVDSLRARYRFEDSSRTEDNDAFRYGSLTWTSGNNSGKSIEIKGFTWAWFALLEAMQYDIEVGDQYLAIRGCDKTRANCAIFSNVINFQGEPDLPGINQMMDYLVTS
jgi:uncharacterized phage protein (TIGR02218 family)